MIAIILNLLMPRQQSRQLNVPKNRTQQRRGCEKRRREENLNRRLVTEIYFSCYRLHSWDKQFPLEVRISIREKFRESLVEALRKYIFTRKIDNIQIDAEEAINLSLEIISCKIQLGKSLPLIYGVEAITEYFADSFNIMQAERRINSERRDQIAS